MHAGEFLFQDTCRWPGTAIVYCAGFAVSGGGGCGRVGTDLCMSGASERLRSSCEGVLCGRGLACCCAVPLLGAGSSVYAHAVDGMPARHNASKLTVFHSWSRSCPLTGSAISAATVSHTATEFLRISRTLVGWRSAVAPPSRAARRVVARKEKFNNVSGKCIRVANPPLDRVDV